MANKKVGVIKEERCTGGQSRIGAAFSGYSLSGAGVSSPSKSGAQSYKSELQKLQEEVSLLTSYCSDTVYRLRYDNMKYDYISPSVVRLLGFTPEEMKKIHFRSLVVETRIVTDGMQTVHSFDELEARRRSGDVNKWQADYLIRTKTGEKIWVSDVSQPWFDDYGAVIGSVGSLRDVTDRVHVEKMARAELERVANTDALTGTASRRVFFTELERELKRIQRTDLQISILMIDVDNFKRINKAYGHEVGDRMLIEIADIIRGCLRDTDVLARIGGEEFGVILPDTSMQGAYWVGDRVRDAISRHLFATGADDNPAQCTVSIGAASAVPSDEAEAASLFKLADTRLYIAKNTGRNQVSVDEVMLTH